MSHTKLSYHIVIRPKHGEQVINLEYEAEFYAFVWGLLKNKGCYLHRIGGMPDHVHLLVELPASLSLSDFVRVLKTSTNRFLKTNPEKFPYFVEWGKEYFAVTCGMEDVNRVCGYIKRQKEHHRQASFREELMALCSEYGIEMGYSV